MDDFQFEQFHINARRTGDMASSALARAEDQLRQRQKEEHARDNAILSTSDSVAKTSKLLKDLDAKLDKERAERIAADEESNKYMVRWNKINLTVSVVAIAVGAIVGIIQIVLSLR